MADYGSSVNFSERTTDIDTPPSGKAGIFLRDDKALYLKNDEGTVTKFGLAGDAPTAHAESHESGGDDELALDAGQVTTGTLPVGRGGTNADLSATGGTGQVLKQTSAGGAVTVGVLAESEIPDLSTDKLTSGTLPIGRGGTNATTAADARTALDVPSLSVFNDHGTRHENGGDDELALDAGQVTTGTLPVGRGGTGATTLTGFVQGTGTSALTAAALAESDIPNLSATKITSDTLGAERLPAGTLTLGVALDSTLRAVEDKAGTASKLKLSTTEVSLDGIKIGLGGGSVGSNLAFSTTLPNNTTGNNLVAVGADVLTSNTTGIYNTGIGSLSLNKTEDGEKNVGIGHATLFNNISGDDNMALGHAALYNITGSKNLGIGSYAGRYAGTGTGANTTSSDSIYIGWTSRAGSSGASRENVIGYNAYGRGNNTTTISEKPVFPDMPTSSSGLPTGSLWSDGGTIKIV